MWLSEVLNCVDCIKLFTHSPLGKPYPTYLSIKQFAGEQGFEPRPTIPETAVLPLDYSPSSFNIKMSLSHSQDEFNIPGSSWKE